MLLDMITKETRTERMSVSLTPTVMARLEKYAAAHRWSASAAAAYLIEDGLAEQDQEVTR